MYNIISWLVLIHHWMRVFLIVKETTITKDCEELIKITLVTKEEFTQFFIRVNLFSIKYIIRR